MGATYSTVTCAEMADSVSENWTIDGLEISVDLKVAWALRYDLIADIVGNRKPYPYFQHCYCSGASLKSDGAASANDGAQGLTYASAIVTAKYSTKIEEILVSETFEPSVEYTQLDHKDFIWGVINEDGGVTLSDPVKEREAPGRALFSMVLSRTIYKVLPPLDPSWLTLPGCVNRDTYTSYLLGLEFEPETLLWMPTTLSRTIKLDGSRAYDLPIKLAYKPEGWNKFWRPKTGQYESFFYTEAYFNSLPPADCLYKNYPPADMSMFLFDDDPGDGED